jgi:hypothetical protein
MFFNSIKAFWAFTQRLVASHIQMFCCVALFGFIIGFATYTYDEIYYPMRTIQSEAVSAVGDGGDAAPANYTWRARSDGRRLTGGGQGGYLRACGRVQFGATCNPTDQAHMVTKEFADYLMYHMPRCVSAGLKAEGLSGNFDKLVIIGDTYANRNARGSSRKSMHSTGRSIDLTKLKITLTNGRQYDVNMTQAGRNASRSNNFYRTVVSCWQNANRTRCSGKGGLTPRSGCLDATYNHAHHNHIHMSMPFCPSKPGIVKN